MKTSIKRMSRDTRIQYISAILSCFKNLAICFAWFGVVASICNVGLKIEWLLILMLCYIILWINRSYLKIIARLDVYSRLIDSEILFKLGDEIGEQYIDRYFRNSKDKKIRRLRKTIYAISYILEVITCLIVVYGNISAWIYISGVYLRFYRGISFLLTIPALIIYLFLWIRKISNSMKKVSRRKETNYGES